MHQMVLEISQTSMHQMVLEISQSQEFEQDGHHHFVDFQLHFHVNMTSDAIQQDNEKIKVQYLRSLLFDLFEILQAVRP